MTLTLLFSRCDTTNWVPSKVLTKCSEWWQQKKYQLLLWQYKIMPNRRQMHKIPDSRFHRNYSNGSVEAGSRVRNLIPKEHMLILVIFPFSSIFSTLAYNRYAVWASIRRSDKLHEAFDTPKAHTFTMLQKHLLSHHPAMQSMGSVPRVCPQCLQPISKSNAQYCTVINRCSILTWWFHQNEQVQSREQALEEHALTDFSRA
jgi:hypothetical protein